MNKQAVPRELLDVRDESGAPTGRTIARGTPLAPGDYLLAVHVWPHSTDGAYLVQRRALHLRSGPGVWATTVGYVQAGEDSVEAAKRETAEELGVSLAASELRPFKRVTTGSLIQDVYLARIAYVPEAGVAFGSDVAAVRWVSRSELAQLIERGEFFPYSYFGELP